MKNLIALITLIAVATLVALIMGATPATAITVVVTATIVATIALIFFVNGGGQKEGKEEEEEEEEEKNMHHDPAVNNRLKPENDMLWYVIYNLEAQIIKKRKSIRIRKNEEKINNLIQKGKISKGTNFDEEIAGKGGKKRYTPLINTHEADRLWYVMYNRSNDGLSRGGHKKSKRGYHDPRYKNKRNEHIRAMKGLDESWYEEVEAF